VVARPRRRAAVTWTNPLCLSTNRSTVFHSSSLASRDSMPFVGTTGGAGACAQGPWSGRQQRTPCCHGQPASAPTDHALAGAVPNMDVPPHRHRHHSTQRSTCSCHCSRPRRCPASSWPPRAVQVWAAAAVLDLFALKL
jgi:hypothetical protein